MGLTTENAGAVVQRVPGRGNGETMYIQITRQTHIGPTVVYVGQVIPVDEHVGRELIAYQKAIEVDRSPAVEKMLEREVPLGRLGTPEDAIALGETARAEIGSDPQPDDPDKAGKPVRPGKSSGKK